MAFDDKFHEECGVFGVYNIPDAAAHVVLGLHALQHRGQEATGIVAYDGMKFHAHRALGAVDRTFGGQNNPIIESLKGTIAIGHNRYATSGDDGLRNVQPLFADLEEGGVAIAHNGNLTNAYRLRREMVVNGRIFQSTSDTEIILHLIAEAKGTIINRLTTALQTVEGAYSLIALTRSKMIGVRDPFGVRPLVLGKLNDSYILASESCALDILGATTIRDVAPGEMIVIDPDGMKSYYPFAINNPQQQASKGHFCIFEFVYFARPDTITNGQSVYQVRTRIGAELAKEHAVDADVIVPIPDSGVPSAIGYSEQSGIPFQYGIIRNHYVGRTFIEPTSEIRHLGVKLKHNPNRHVLEGKRVILVDDSIVRGTTSRKIVEMVRNAGATQVHLRIASPPTKHSCFFGVDTPSPNELLASNYDLEAMAALIGVESLGFISLDGLYRASGNPDGRSDQLDARGYCDACFSGEYHIKLKDADDAANSKQQPRQLSLLKEG
ncbi:MAG: amidophosphoribosyltransferase [Alphaproteobacteria bacterium]